MMLEGFGFLMFMFAFIFSQHIQDEKMKHVIKDSIKENEKEKSRS